jgi:hypothetical protein
MQGGGSGGRAAAGVGRNAGGMRGRVHKHRVRGRGAH